MSTPSHSTQPHVVAVIGGATAGAEVADRLASAGVRVVVFEMNPRPFGKIEDGLPRWHHGLRNKEYETIQTKLGQDNVSFVPKTKIGEDIAFEEIAREWGFSAVVLANGAWRDRSLPIEGADQWVGKGLEYQNPFIIWFNHLEEEGADPNLFETPDDALVVGGGLASIDVAKVMMLETTRAKLLERGIEVNMIDLEVKGIPKILAQHDLEWDDLGLKGCTIFYRRNVEDMPVAEIPDGADEARVTKVRTARARLLAKAMDKFKFKIEPLSAPDGLIIENDRVVGVRMRRTQIEGNRVIPTDETYEQRGSIVVSSIGSIPEAIPGIEMKGELFAFTDWDIGRLDGYPNLFSVGNVVTGKGNIVASRKHASAVYDAALESFLGLAEDGHEAEAALSDGGNEGAEQAAAGVLAAIGTTEPPSAETLAAIEQRVAARQREVGYGGDLREWVAQVSPKELA